MTTTIPFDQLPQKAKDRISKAQQSYADEFTFKRRADGDIEAWYANELLVVWFEHTQAWADPRGRGQPNDCTCCRH